MTLDPSRLEQEYEKGCKGLDIPNFQVCVSSLKLEPMALQGSSSVLEGFAR
jgi:hypothetical protein